MAKSSPRIPKYRKHKPSGQAVVTLNGHDHYLGPHGTEVSKNEYDRLIAEWLATGRTGRRSDAAITIDQLTLAYWKHVQGYYEPRTAGGMKVALRGFRRLYGPQEAREIGPIALKAFRQELIGEELSRVSAIPRSRPLRSMRSAADHSRTRSRWRAAEPPKRTPWPGVSLSTALVYLPMSMGSSSSRSVERKSCSKSPTLWLRPSRCSRVEAGCQTYR